MLLVKMNYIFIFIYNFFFIALCYLLSGVTTPSTTISTTSLPDDCFNVTLTTQKYGRDISWSVGTCTSNRCYRCNQSYTDYSLFTQECCIGNGTTDALITCTDGYGDGWDGAYIEINGQQYCENFTTGFEQTETLSIPQAGEILYFNS